MTKKTYIQPTTKFAVMDGEEMLAGSTTLGVGGTEVGGGLAKESFFDDFDEEDSYVEENISSED